MSKTIDVCLSPELLHLYPVENKLVVVVDILRATSCMTAGIANGVKSITPKADLEECRKLKEKGYIIAGERNGKHVEGFDLGNSPFGYMNEEYKGKKIGVTTTNGTVAINKSKNASEVIIGSFLNLSAVAEHCKKSPYDVLILCAGWKGKVNMEDSLFAGALVEALNETHKSACDPPLMMEKMYQAAKSDLLGFVQKSSHVSRLQKIGIGKDIEFCLEIDKYTEIPVLRGEELIKL
ncbi:2-phosphosulfolactate phosphatase [Marinigracilibium pacificum]|uniref:Probable 2-phosphosulfolactate phosphatase n=1 Tax=Marinigracilibium pacificum TaxID=2729599 RepID=A0A848J069_9BACT|nr:2-phosphosulfolactate phosphatase [Marinigracilibium pacificum]NMM48778.1 2-phosphosulfolactate phosphatase [Marinigracilibium pacificum]